jgi:hypothetical protein
MERRIRRRTEVMEDEKEDVYNCWMTLMKQEDTGN